MAEKNPQEFTDSAKRKVSTRGRIGIAILEILFIGGLLAVWFGFEPVRHSKSLWILFFYSFPSMFLIAVVPHEPVLLFFSKFHPNWIVTLVALAGTLLTELLNYHCFSTFADLKIFDKVRENRIVKYLIHLFNKAPFLALWIAGFTPVPFYPFRFLVVLASYPVWKYQLALILSRTPRFFILALLGKSLQIPDWALIVFFVCITVMLNLPFLKGLKKSPRPADSN